MRAYTRGEIEAIIRAAFRAGWYEARARPTATLRTQDVPVLEDVVRVHHTCDHGPLARRGTMGRPAGAHGP